jgi:hypothetical protein
MRREDRKQPARTHAKFPRRSSWINRGFIEKLASQRKAAVFAA